jgi:glyoxylase-like metal-dependent hydrolase (beta-lactamase superfamily II)
VQNKIHPKIEVLEIPWEKARTKIIAYLVKGTQNAMIDTGPPQPSPDNITNIIKAFGIKISDISKVINTHGHVDHVGGNPVFKANGKPELMIHKEDAVFIEDPGKSFDMFFAPMFKALGMADKIEQEKAGYIMGCGDPLEVDRKLQDNDIIDLGGGVELRVVHLPGHTFGSVGYYWEKEGILFSGDSICGLGTPEGSLPIIYDLALYKKSMERLLTMPIKHLLGVHPYRELNQPPSSIKTGSEVKKFLKTSKEAAGCIADAVAKQRTTDGKSLNVIVDEIIDRIPAEFGFKHIAELPMPHFSLTTVFFGLLK